jgi:hypothetical protein
VTRPGRIAAVALLVGSLLGLGACGGSGSGISSSAAAQLQLRVAAIRDAASQGDTSAAESQLADLRVDVVEFRAGNKLDDAAATRILDAADAVGTQLALLEPSTTTTLATTTTTTETTTTTTPPSSTMPKPPPPDGPKGHDKGPGKHGDDGR